MSLTASVRCSAQGTPSGSHVTALVEAECSNNRMQIGTTCVFRPLVLPSAAWTIYSRTELYIKAANVARVCQNTANGTDLCVNTDEGLFHRALWKKTGFFSIVADIFGVLYLFPLKLIWQRCKSDYVPGWSQGSLPTSLLWLAQFACKVICLWCTCPPGLTVSGVLKGFPNKGDSQLTECNLLYLDEQK